MLVLGMYHALFTCTFFYFILISVIRSQIVYNFEKFYSFAYVCTCILKKYNAPFENWNRLRLNKFCAKMVHFTNFFPSMEYRFAYLDPKCRYLNEGTKNICIFYKELHSHKLSPPKPNFSHKYWQS